MKTELDEGIVTEVGHMRVRTLSHYLFFKKPRTTIFLTADPWKEDTIVTITWNTSDANILQGLHRRVMASIEEHGFTPMKEAARLLHSNVEAQITVGKVKLLGLLSKEVGAHVTFVA